MRKKTSKIVPLLAITILVILMLDGNRLNLSNGKLKAVSNNTETKYSQADYQMMEKAFGNQNNSEVEGEETSEESFFAWDEEETEKISSVSLEKYAYQTLDEETKIVYDEVYDALLQHKEKISVSTKDYQVLEKAHRAVMSDYGEIFWASGYVYTQYTRGDTLVGLDFAPKYSMTYEERQEMQQKIDIVVEQILAGVSDTASEYEKALYVFEYLVKHVEYQAGAPDNQNIISVFINGATVCSGYASATQYLLDKLGIQSAIITGDAAGESHAWNLARLDGEYYYIDTTWGNSSYQSADAGLGKFVNYNYFAITTEELEQTHSPNGEIDLPLCVATQDNYYVREGLFFTEWNADEIGNILNQAYQQGNCVISVKFSESDYYQQCVSYFIGEQHIADYCSGITSIFYMEDELQRVLTIKF